MHPFVCTMCAVGLCLPVSAMSASAISAPPIPQALTSQPPMRSPVQPPVQFSITLEQAIASALANHPDLTVAQREIAAVEGQVLQSQVRPNPELSYGLEDVQRDRRSQSVQLNMPIERGGKRMARMAAATGGLAVAVADLEVRRAEIRAEVTEAFLTLAVAQLRDQLAQDSIALAKRATDAVSKRMTAGKVSPVELTKAQIAEANVQLEWVQAQTALQQAKTQLRLLMGGVDGGSTGDAVDVQVDTSALYASPFFASDAISNITKIDIAAIEAQLDTHLAQAPLVQRALREIDRRQAVVQVERSKQTADATWSVGIKRSSTPNELQRDQLLLGVAIPLRVFDQNRGNLQEALRREDKARDEVAALTLQLRRVVLDAYARLSAAQREMTVLQHTIMPNAKQAYEAATQGFVYGKFSFLEVLDAQRTYFAAQAQSMQVMGELYRAMTDIERVLGQKLGQPLGQLLNQTTVGAQSK
jgi:cobalt-zinc-cadmium efflux system outer membrane protein